MKEQELIELITHLAFYAGWPSAMSCMAVAKELFMKTKENRWCPLALPRQSPDQAMQRTAGRSDLWLWYDYNLLSAATRFLARGR